MWEIFTLSKNRPFHNAVNETNLIVRVYSDERPPVNELDPDLPVTIKDMIMKCWDKDRGIRLTAIDCVSILDNEYISITDKCYHIFLSHRWESKPVVRHIYLMLKTLGYKVW